MAGDRLISDIERWRQLAIALEADTGERQALTRQAVAVAERYQQAVDSAPIYSVGADPATDSPATGFVEQATPAAEVFAEVERRVGDHGLRFDSGRMLGFIPGSGLHASALGDYLAAVTNRYVGATYAAADAVRMEQQILAWLASELGYPATAAGDLTSGGSLANLSAIVAAREAHQIEPATLAQQVIYCTALAHHCLDKAIRVAGMHHAVLRRVAMDESYRMSPSALEQQLQSDRRQGLRPWLLIASAGATDTGSVDPLAELAEIADRYGLWYHIDGAYGGAFALCDTGRERLSGLGRSDSLVLDPHKGLFIPFGSGALLVRQGERLRSAFTQTANYMADAERLAVGDLYEPHEYSLELSRHFRGLRIWLPLKLYGLAPFRAALQEKLLLAQYFHQQLATIPGIQRGPAPDLSVVTFRYQPQRGNSDDFNRALLQWIQQQGRLFLTSTTLDGRYTLRLAILAYRTHREVIDEVLETLRAGIEAVSATR
ncbi:MAG: aminotransferase class I/II-fold pyridoxal phosphate-dependent enzyme [Wenzhouxiangellaceae bacterium]